MGRAQGAKTFPRDRTLTETCSVAVPMLGTVAPVAGKAGRGSSPWWVSESSLGTQRRRPPSSLHRARPEATGDSGFPKASWEPRWTLSTGRAEALLWGAEGHPGRETPRPDPLLLAPSAPAPPADPAEAEGAHHRLRRLQPLVLAGSRAGRHHGGHAVCRLPGGGEGRLPGEHPLCPCPGSSELACPREGSSRLSPQGISVVLSTPLRWPRLDKPSLCSPTHLSESAHTGAPRCSPRQPGRRGPRGGPGGFKSGRRNGLPGRGPSAHCLPAMGPSPRPLQSHRVTPGAP